MKERRVSNKVVSVRRNFMQVASKLVRSSVTWSKVVDTKVI